MSLRHDKTIVPSIVGALALLVVTSKLIVAPLARRTLAQPTKCDRILVSLPYSHFVEAARWAMERHGLKIWEIKVPIGPHVAVTTFFRLLFRHGLSSTSSYPGQGFTDSWIPTITNTTLRRLASVPLVVNTQTECCLPDSWGVLEDCSMPVCETVRDRWDNDFGPSVRQVGYYYIFQDKAIYRQIQSCNRFWMFYHDILERMMSLTYFMKLMMKMTPEEVATAELRIKKEFDRVSTILQENSYLGDGTGSSTFGGADIAFSALAGWLILPENFHNGNVNVPDKAVLPGKLKELMDELESTMAANHVRRCYQLRSEIVKPNSKKDS
jgi:hypothetical protein